MTWGDGQACVFQELSVVWELGSGWGWTARWWGQGPRAEGLGAQDGLPHSESGPLLIRGESEPWVD